MTYSSQLQEERGKKTPVKWGRSHLLPLDGATASKTVDLPELLIRALFHQPFVYQIKILSTAFAAMFWAQGHIKTNPEFCIFHACVCCFLFVSNVTCKNLPAPSRLLRSTYIPNNTRGICAQVKNGSQTRKVTASTWGRLRRWFLCHLRKWLRRGTRGGGKM